jgi:hypothetical protein
MGVRTLTQRYIHKFSVLGLAFTRRPVSDPPADKTLCFVDDGVGGGWQDRDVGVFNDGEWRKPSGRKLRFTPAYWAVLDERP